ncbi:MAG: hypothetical protein ABI706_08700 [Ilumatobacteraceae bacterium]
MRTGNERGEANALGLVLIAPVAIALAVLVLWIGRRVDADAQVQAASSAAAQSAAHQRTPAAAVVAAQSTAALMLTDVKECAGGPAIWIDASQFKAGGVVTVVVGCSPERTDVGLAGSRAATFVATSSASIDAYRSAGVP